MKNNIIEDSKKYNIQNPSSATPFLKIENGFLTRKSHCQIQQREFYDFFKKYSKATTENFTITLEYKGMKKDSILKGEVPITLKGESKTAGILLKQFIQKLVNQGYCNPLDLAPGKPMEFLKIKEKEEFVLKLSNSPIFNDLDSTKLNLNGKITPLKIIFKEKGFLDDMFKELQR